MVLVGWDMGNRKDGSVGWSTVTELPDQRLQCYTCAGQ